MRRIERTKSFKRDFKKILSTPKHSDIEETILPILNSLAMDKPLPVKQLDHQLTGNWKDHRDCHVKPDLILIYRKKKSNVLQLVRIGSHSSLGI